MRQATMMVITTMATLGIGAAAVTGVMADEYPGTSEQQMACTPDVFRFCGNAIPDVDRIVVCLRQNVPLLSRDCRAVFAANNDDGVVQPPRPSRTARQGRHAWRCSADCQRHWEQ